MLGRMWEDGRRKRLHIVSQRPVIDQIQAAMELGYRGLSRRFEYAIDFHPAEAGRPLEVLGAGFQFAETRHSVTNYAVRIEIGGLAVCYSGDGVYTEASRALFRDANLLIHEAYSFDQSPVHGDIPGVIALAEEQFVAQLALVHVQRAVRRSQEFLERIHRMGDGTMLTLPHPGAVLYLE